MASRRTRDSARRCSISSKPAATRRAWRPSRSSPGISSARPTTISRGAAGNHECGVRLMLTKEENDLLTRTGPDTDGGALLRRYWQPVALAEELPPGGAPLPVQVLGEQLVLFRDDQGRPGLLGLHCSHRGADLSYGRCEAGGLRCLYHGWLYDAAGRCLEQPGEPAGSTFKDRVRHPAYPCREAGPFISPTWGPASRRCCRPTSSCKRPRRTSGRSRSSTSATTCRVM